MTSGAATGMTRCRVCGGGLSSQPSLGSREPVFPCAVCGTYRLSEYAAQRLYELTGALEGRVALFTDHHLLSAVLRERYMAQQGEVYVESLEELLAAARPLAGGFIEAAERLLLYVSDNLPRLGMPVMMAPTVDYPIAFARDGTEFIHIAKLAEQLNYLNVSGGDADTRLTVTPHGWTRLQDLRARRVDRRQAFVAMWFSDTMTAAFTDGIEPALRATGYRALRIDRVEHNDKVDDRIIAAIRQSGLLVADFTGGRGGVYFEAGFAMGLGLPVIWTCRREEFDRDGVHFDTRQYNHIVWSDPDDLRERLQARIEATLPTSTRAAST